MQQDKIITLLVHYEFGIIIFVFTKKYEMGLTGFEPATSGTQSPNHTKLDHNPLECAH